MPKIVNDPIMKKLPYSVSITMQNFIFLNNLQSRGVKVREKVNQLINLWRENEEQRGNADVKLIVCECGCEYSEKMSQCPSCKKVKENGQIQGNAQEA